MVATTSAKKRVGERSGTVTRQNTVQLEAPSMRAASSTSSGTEDSPADMMMKERPMNCQMAMMATAGRAQVVDCEDRRLGVDAQPGQQPHDRVHQRVEHQGGHGHRGDDGG